MASHGDPVVLEVAGRAVTVTNPAKVYFPEAGITKSGFFYHLLSALLSIIVGMMFLRAPIGSLAVLTLLLATLLMVGGIFKIVAAVNYRFAGWGWPAIGGLVDFLLGLLIWQEWPASALWVVGMYVGINLLFRGIAPEREARPGRGPGPAAGSAPAPSGGAERAPAQRSAKPRRTAKTAKTPKSAESPAPAAPGGGSGRASPRAPGRDSQGERRGAGGRARTEGTVAAPARSAKRRRS